MTEKHDITTSDAARAIALSDCVEGSQLEALAHCRRNRRGRCRNLYRLE